MTYEFCLEYGTYPLIPVDALMEERKVAPDFIAQDTQLLERLEALNTLFHDLFLTIECQFHYVGSQYPEKIATLKAMYQEIADYLTATYGDSVDIKIEHFVLS